MSTPSRFKQALRIVLRYDENAKLNLFEVFPGLKHFFIHRRNLAYIRTFGDLFFTALIILGLFGPQDPQRNVSLFILWGIWWTGVVMSWFYTGRLWCGFCPFPGIGRFFQRFGLSLNLDVPNIFKKYCVYLAVILLAVIIWTEEVTNLKSWPAGTAYLLISILLGATVLGVIFKGQAWCRHVCPLGKMIGSASTLSLTEFRPDFSKCKTCKTFACRRGTDSAPGCPVYLGAINVRNNLNCLVCGRCISLCDSDSPRINLRNPFTELVINKGRYLTCSYFIPFLMGSQLARFIHHAPMYQSLESVFLNSDPLAFTSILIIGFILFIAIIRLGGWLFTITEDEVFGRFSPLIPVLIPLAFAGELAYRLKYLLTNLGDFFPTFGRQFGFNTVYLAFTIPEFFSLTVCCFVLAIGGMAGSYVLYLFYHGDFEGMIPRKNYLTIHLLFFLVFLSYIALFGQTFAFD